MRGAAARRRAGELYGGGSLPISVLKEGCDALSLDWWRTSPQPETAGSGRHAAALRLYLEIGRSSRPQLPEISFPAVMDFEDEAMRPDKGVMKVFLDEGLVEGRMMGAQLVFDLTDHGTEFLARSDQSG